MGHRDMVMGIANMSQIKHNVHWADCRPGIRLYVSQPPSDLTFGMPRTSGR
jgi:hypothetical protein